MSESTPSKIKNFFQSQDEKSKKRQERTPEQIMSEAELNLVQTVVSKINKINPEDETKILELDKIVSLPRIYLDLDNQEIWIDENHKKSIENRNYSLPRLIAESYSSWHLNILDILTSESPTYSKDDIEKRNQRLVRSFGQDIFKTFKKFEYLLPAGSKLKKSLDSEFISEEFAELLVHSMNEGYKSNYPSFVPNTLLAVLKKCMCLDSLIKDPTAKLLPALNEFRLARQAADLANLEVAELVDTQVSQSEIADVNTKLDFKKGISEPTQTIPRVEMYTPDSTKLKNDFTSNQDNPNQQNQVLNIEIADKLFDKPKPKNILVLPDGRKIVTTGEIVDKIAISQVIGQIQESLKRGGNIVIKTPTGSGKSEVINQLLYSHQINADNIGVVVQPTRNNTDNYAKTAGIFNITGKHLPYYSFDPNRAYTPEEILVDEETGQATIKVWEIVENQGQANETKKYLLYNTDKETEIPAGAVLKEYLLETSEEIKVTELKQSYTRNGEIYGQQYGDDTKIPKDQIRVTPKNYRLAVQRRGLNTIQYNNQNKIESPAIVVTDGTAVNYSINDPLLWDKSENGKKISTVVFDELDRGNLFQLQFLAHVKWLNETGLRQKAGLPPLRIIITSATVATAFIKQYLNCKDEDIIELPIPERPNQAIPLFLNPETDSYPKDFVSASMENDKVNLILEKLRNQLVDEDNQPKMAQGEAIAIFLPTISDINALQSYIAGNEELWKLPFKIDIRPFHGQMEAEELAEFREAPALPGEVVVYLATDAMAYGITTKPPITGLIIDPVVLRPFYDEISEVTIMQRQLMSEAVLTQEMGRAGRTDGNQKLDKEIIADVLCPEDTKLPAQEQSSLLKSNLDLLVLSVLHSFQSVKAKLKHKLDINQSGNIFDINNYPFPVSLQSDRIGQIVNKLKQIKAIDSENNLTELGIFLKDLSFPATTGVMIYEAAQKKLGFEAMAIGALIGNSKGLWRLDSKNWFYNEEDLFYKKVKNIATTSNSIRSQDIFVKYTEKQFDEQPLYIKGAILKNEYDELKNRIDTIEKQHQKNNNQSISTKFKAEIEGLSHDLEKLGNEIADVAEKNYNNIFKRRNILKSLGVEAALFESEKIRLEDIISTINFAKEKRLTVSTYYEDKLLEAERRIADLDQKINDIAKVYPVSDWIVGLDVLTYFNSLPDNEKNVFIYKFGLSKKALNDINAARRDTTVSLVEKRKSLLKARQGGNPGSLENILEDIEMEPNYINPNETNIGTIRTRELKRINNELNEAIIKAFGERIFKSDGNIINRIWNKLNKNVSLSPTSGVIKRYQSQELTLLCIGNATDLGSRNIVGNMIHRIKAQDIVKESGNNFRYNTNDKNDKFDAETGNLIQIYEFEFIAPDNKVINIGTSYIEKKLENVDEYLAKYLVEQKSNASHHIYKQNLEVIENLKGLYIRSFGTIKKFNQADLYPFYLQKIRETGISKLSDLENNNITSQFILNLETFVDANTIEDINKFSPLEIAGKKLEYREINEKNADNLSFKGENKPVDFMATTDLSVDEILALEIPLTVPSDIPIYYKLPDTYRTFTDFNTVRQEAATQKMYQQWRAFSVSEIGVSTMIDFNDPGELLGYELPPRQIYAQHPLTGEDQIAYPYLTLSYGKVYLKYERTIEEVKQKRDEFAKDLQEKIEEYRENKKQLEMSIEAKKILTSSSLEENLNKLYELDVSEYSKMYGVYENLYDKAESGNTDQVDLKNVKELILDIQNYLDNQQRLADLQNKTVVEKERNIKIVESNINDFLAKYGRKYVSEDIKSNDDISGKRKLTIAVLTTGADAYGENGKILAKVQVRFNDDYRQDIETIITRYSSNNLPPYEKHDYWQPITGNLGEIETFEYDVLVTDEERAELERQRKIDEYKTMERTAKRDGCGYARFIKNEKNGSWTYQVRQKGKLLIYEIQPGTLVPAINTIKHQYYYSVIEQKPIKKIGEEDVIKFVVQLKQPFPYQHPDFEADTNIESDTKTVKEGVKNTPAPVVDNDQLAKLRDAFKKSNNDKKKRR